jgi:hypothetical protein
MTNWLGWLRSASESKAKPHALMQEEPILAFRAWRVFGSRLLSCTCECIWQPRVRLDASCNKKIAHGNAPAWDCQCGIYAYKTERALTDSPFAIPEHGPSVRGRVALWGRVVDHGLGYRAQYAYPQVLYLLGDDSDGAVRDLADSYAVEAVPLLPLNVK